MSRGRQAKGKWQSIGWVFVAPFVILFACFYLVPILSAISDSLFRVTSSGLGLDGAQTTTFVGFENYVRALTNGELANASVNVLKYAIIAMPIGLGLALVLALLIDSAVTRLRRVFRFIYFAPYAVPGVIAALLWAFLYSPGISPIVAGLRAVGLPGDLLAPGTVLFSIANMSVWQFTGYNMIILFAALQAIPRDLYEAAIIDGASGWSIATRIKIPLIRPALILVTFFGLIGSLQLFTEPFVLRQITSAVTSTYTPNMVAYSAAFIANNRNYASAVAVIVAIVTFAASFGFRAIASRRAE